MERITNIYFNRYLIYCPEKEITYRVALDMKLFAIKVAKCKQSSSLTSIQNTKKITITILITNCQNAAEEKRWFR
jgi:hypothetical protein